MQRPGLFKMLVRGSFRRCGWCGGRNAFFTSWFHKSEHCRSCGLQWRRGDVGFELGAAAIAVIITFGPLLVVLGIMVAAMWPDVNVVPMFVVLGSLAVVLPLLLYGSAYTIWQAIDIVMRPPSPDDFEIVADLDPGIGDVDAASGLGGGRDGAGDVRPDDA